MGVRILSDGEKAVLYCSTSDWAFGPVFGKGDHDQDPEKRALRFCRWLEQNFGFERHPLGSSNDPRSLTDGGMQTAYSKWLYDTSPFGGDAHCKCGQRLEEDDDGECWTCYISDEEDDIEQARRQA